MTWKKWVYWIKLVVGVLLIAFLYHQIDQSESILAQLQGSSWTHIGICLILLIPNLGLAWAKWFYLLRRRLPDVKASEAWGSLMFGFTLGLVTPGRLGELARGLFFERHDKVVVTGINVLDKALNQAVIFTLGALALSIFAAGEGVLSERQLNLLLGIGGVLLVVFWAVLLNPGLITRVLKRFSRGPEDIPAHLAAAVENLRRRDILISAAIALVWFVVIALQYHVLVRAFTPVAVADSLQAVFAILFVKTLIPLTFGDLGIRESVAILFYGALGTSKAAVFNASMLVFLINFLIPALWGGYYLFRMRATGQRLTITLPGKKPLPESNPGGNPVP